MHQRGRELHALLIAERQVLDAIVRTLRDAEDLDRLCGPTRSVGPRQPVQPREVHELLEHFHLRDRGRVPPACSRTGVAPPRRAAVRCQSDLAGVGLEHAERDAHRGRLARAVRPDEPDDLAVRHREGDAVQGDDVAEATRETDQLEHEYRHDTTRNRVGRHAHRRRSNRRPCSAGVQPNPSIAERYSRGNGAAHPAAGRSDPAPRCPRP